MSPEPTSRASPCYRTIPAANKLVFSSFAALAEFEREPIAQRTLAGLSSAQAHGRLFKMAAAKLRMGIAVIGQLEITFGDLCQ